MEKGTFEDLRSTFQKKYFVKEKISLCTQINMDKIRGTNFEGIISGCTSSYHSGLIT